MCVMRRRMRFATNTSARIRPDVFWIGSRFSRLKQGCGAQSPGTKHFWSYRYEQLLCMSFLWARWAGRYSLARAYAVGERLVDGRADRSTTTDLPARSGVLPKLYVGAD